jgi:beta-lactam-binding protein with PASTA domain
VVKKSSGGRTIAIILIVALAVVGVLFATGFWKADVSGGDVPEVSVKGGALPKVDLDSKEVVVGTKKEVVEVPTVGVKDNGEK